MGNRITKIEVVGDKKTIQLKSGLPNAELFYTRTIYEYSRKNNYDTYLYFLDVIEDIINHNMDMVHKKLFVVLDDGSKFVMSLSAFFINMVLWGINVYFGEPICKEDIYEFDNITKGTYNKIMDTIISKYIDMGYDLDENVNIIAHIRFRISRVIKTYGSYMAGTFSYYDLMCLEERRPDFSELFNTDLNKMDMLVSEMGDYLDEAAKELLRIIEDDAQSALYPYTTTGILNKTQFQQMFIAVGPRYNMDKTILPTIISRNWCIGLQSVAEFYAESIQTRNGIILKKKSVPDSGYLSRKASIASIGTVLNTDIIDCGTKHYVEYTIDSQDDLDFLEGRYMVIDTDGPILRPIKVTDSHLIGSTIKFRSHTKCITAHTLNEVCSICFGNKHKTLGKSRIGGLVPPKYINPMSQGGLAGKHAMLVLMKAIKDYLLTKYFTYNNTSVHVKQGAHLNGDVKLLIPTEVVNDILAASSEFKYKKSEDMDGIEFSTEIPDLFILHNGTLHSMSLSDKNYNLYLSKKLVDRIGNGKYPLILSSEIIDYGMGGGSEDSEYSEYVGVDLKGVKFPILDINMITEEMTKFLKMTTRMIDGDLTKTFDDVDELLKELFHVAKDAKINTFGLSIHIDTLLLNMMRDRSDTMGKPDFSKKVEPDVQFLTLNILNKKKDLTSGLNYQELKAQLKDPMSLRKNEPGMYDPFFANSDYLKNTKEFKKKRPYLFGKKK